MSKIRSTKILFPLLAAVLLLALLPATALAADGGEPPSTDGTRIYANGTAVVLKKEVGGTVNMYAASDTEFLSPLFKDIGDKVIYAGWQNGDHTGDTSLTVLDGVFTKTIYGGSREGKITGNTNLDIRGGTLAWMYGGNWQGSVSGNTNIYASGCTLSEAVYGGSYEGTITGNTTIEIGTVTIKSNIYGGGYAAASSVAGNTYITLRNGTMQSGNVVYGGGNNGLVAGTATIQVEGGDLGNSTLYGSGEGIGTRVANSVIEVGGDAIVGSVQGGGLYGTVTGDASITIKDSATINNLVYGGGHNSPYAVSVGGKVTITLQDTAIVKGAIRGSASASGSVGSAEINLLGGSVTGNIWGPAVCGASSNHSSVLGSTTIRVHSDATIKNDQGYIPVIALVAPGAGISVGEGSAIIYAVEYHANGGSGAAPSTTYKAENDTFAAEMNPFTAPSGKQFKEWNTLADGGGTSYDEGSLIEMQSENISLYAIWEDIPLNSDKDVVSITTPGDAQISGTNITATVENSVTSLIIDLTVSPSASWKLYGDVACQNEIENKTITLTVGENMAYVQVTAEDGSTKTYTLIITRKAPGGSYTPPAETTLYNDPSVPASTVWLSGSGLSQGDRLITQPITSGGGYNALVQLADKGDILRVYDISLQSGSKSTGGAMHLTFSAGGQYAGQALTLVHQKADGSIEYFHAMADASGNVRFGPLYELSPFMLVKGSLQRATMLGVPKTGDTTGTITFVLLSLAAACGAGAVVYRKRHT